MPTFSGHLYTCASANVRTRAQLNSSVLHTQSHPQRPRASRLIHSRRQHRTRARLGAMGLARERLLSMGLTSFLARQTPIERYTVCVCVSAAFRPTHHRPHIIPRAKQLRAPSKSCPLPAHFHPGLKPPIHGDASMS